MNTATYQPGDRVLILDEGGSHQHSPRHYLVVGSEGEVIGAHPGVESVYRVRAGGRNLAGGQLKQWVAATSLVPTPTTNLSRLADRIDRQATELLDTADEVASLARKLSE